MVVDHAVWNSADVLRANRDRLIKRLRQSIRTYEARYELSSERLCDELAAGRLRETAEICDWLMDWETYQALTGEQSTRVE